MIEDDIQYVLQQKVVAITTYDMFGYDRGFILTLENGNQISIEPEYYKQLSAARLKIRIKIHALDVFP